MDDVDVLTLVIQEMSKEFPTLMETLVHERDRWVSFGFIYVLKLSAFMSKDDPISFFLVLVTLWEIERKIEAIVNSIVVSPSMINILLE